MWNQVGSAPGGPSDVSGSGQCIGVSFVPLRDSQSLLPAGAYGGEFCSEHWEWWGPDLETAEPICSEQRGWVDITYESPDSPQWITPSVHALIGVGSVTVESQESEGQPNAPITAIRAGIGVRFSVPLTTVLAVTAFVYIFAVVTTAIF
jgi:hypothetical protein